jgi:hypothetical protein
MAYRGRALCELVGHPLSVTVPNMYSPATVAYSVRRVGVRRALVRHQPALQVSQKMLQHFQKCCIIFKNIGSSIFSKQMLVHMFSKNARSTIKNVGSTFCLKKCCNIFKKCCNILSLIIMRWDGWKMVSNKFRWAFGGLKVSTFIHLPQDI